jgi:hypothetical protein
MRARSARIIRWNSHETVKCPVGALASHRHWGRVRILSSSGWNRLIEALEPPESDARGAWGRWVALVDVRELEAGRRSL